MSHQQHRSFHFHLVHFNLCENIHRSHAKPQILPNSESQGDQTCCLQFSNTDGQNKQEITKTPSTWVKSSPQFVLRLFVAFLFSRHVMYCMLSSVVDWDNSVIMQRSPLVMYLEKLDSENSGKNMRKVYCPFSQPIL